MELKFLSALDYNKNKRTLVEAIKKVIDSDFERGMYVKRHMKFFSHRKTIEYTGDELILQNILKRIKIKDNN